MSLDQYRHSSTVTKLVCATLLVLNTQIGRAQLIKQTLPQILSTLSSAKVDSQRVRALLTLDSLYLYQSPDTKNILDSALLLAQEAQRLSASSGYFSGYEDATFMVANAFAEKLDMNAAVGVANSVSGNLRVRILIMIGERYLFRPGELKENIDSSRPFIEAAVKYSDSSRDMDGLYKSLCLKGKYFFALGNMDSGRACFQFMIRHTHQDGKTSEEAHWHAELGRYMPHTNSTYEESVAELTKSEKLYDQLKDRHWQIEILEVLAYLHKLKPNYTTQAEAELKKAISLRKAVESRKLFLDYVELSDINETKGNFNNALLYADSAVRQMEMSHNENFSGGMIYSQAAKVYKAIGDGRTSVGYYEKALDHLVDYRNEYLFPIGSKIVAGLLDLDSPRQALVFLNRFIKQNPPERIVDKEIVAASFGNCYVSLKRFDLAEYYYKEMIALDEQAQAHMEKQTVGERSNTITGSEAYYQMGNFYTKKGDFNKAKPYLEKSLSFERFGPSVERQIDLHQLMFQIDSASDNPVSAIRHLKIRQQLHDSIFTDRKAKQIAELQVQFATEKKEKDLEIIRAKEKINDQALESYAKVRSITFILIALMVVLIVVGYSRYKQKQKSNRQLRQQQEVIDQKNWKLQELLNDKDFLLADKDRLLEEKEILVKEIHHRVKNNLQIVISLLNTQSKYLDNEDAIHAITDSRFRMQAMSLIHEKLYQSENTSTVNLQTYISELAYYLKNSYNLGEIIEFKVDVEDVELNLAQAIPLGLIINEVITNSIKYAFVGRKDGCIEIRMTGKAEKMVHLLIRDNGIGLAPDIDMRKGKSMGMRLINGLGKQLNASITIDSTSGVSLTIRFRAEKAVTSATELTERMISSEHI